MAQIIRIDVSSMEAKRFSKRNESVPNIRIDHNSTVTRAIKVQPDKASLDFRFAVNYSSIGYIVMEGSLLVEDKDSVISDRWTATSALPQEEAVPIHNAIVSYCAPIAMILSRDLHLPSPIPLPHINPQQGNKPQMPPRSSIGPEFA